MNEFDETSEEFLVGCERENPLEFSGSLSSSVPAVPSFKSDVDNGRDNSEEREILFSSDEAIKNWMKCVVDKYQLKVSNEEEKYDGNNTFSIFANIDTCDDKTLDEATWAFFDCRSYANFFQYLDLLGLTSNEMQIFSHTNACSVTTGGKTTYYGPCGGANELFLCLGNLAVSLISPNKLVILPDMKKLRLLEEIEDKQEPFRHNKFFQPLEIVQFFRGFKGITYKIYGRIEFVGRQMKYIPIPTTKDKNKEEAKAQQCKIAIPNRCTAAALLYRSCCHRLPQVLLEHILSFLKFPHRRLLPHDRVDIVLQTIQTRVLPFDLVATEQQPQQQQQQPSSRSAGEVEEQKDIIDLKCFDYQCATEYLFRMKMQYSCQPHDHSPMKVDKWRALIEKRGYYSTELSRVLHQGDELLLVDGNGDSHCAYDDGYY